MIIYKSRYKSRYTPGLENGKDVFFNKGEIVTYKLLSGGVVKITIDSEIMKHSQAPGNKTGYDSIFHDTGERAFAIRICWEGKV